MDALPPRQSTTADRSKRRCFTGLAMQDDSELVLVHPQKDSEKGLTSLSAHVLLLQAKQRENVGTLSSLCFAPGCAVGNDFALGVSPCSPFRHVTRVSNLVPVLCLCSNTQKTPQSSSLSQTTSKCCCSLHRAVFNPKSVSPL